MPTLDEGLHHLRGLADHPPSPVPPVGVVERRARRVRRDRWSSRAVAAAVVVALCATVVVTQTEPEREVSSASTTSTTLDPEATLTVEPSAGLRPNQAVTLTLPLDAAVDASMIVAQCGVEATRAAPEQWCQVLAPFVEVESSRTYEVRIHRMIQTTNGVIDCAERAERCVLGVRLGGVDHTTPISFDEDLPPLDPEIEVEAASPFLATVTGSGYEPGASVTIAQCRPAPDQAPAPTFADCDRHRAARVVTDDDGAFNAEVYLYRQIFSDYTGWGPCQPCQLQAIGSTAETQAAAVDASSGLEGRAAVEIRPGGPYAPGQLVELHGSGFAPAATLEDIVIAWCAFKTADPSTEPQGAGPEYADCVHPDGTGRSVTTNDFGGFTISDFPLPAGPFGGSQVTCTAPADRCGLAWHPGEGAVPYFVTEFQLTHG